MKTHGYEDEACSTEEKAKAEKLSDGVHEKDVL